MSMLPTIVGVTGMWHPASCFDDLKAAFEEKGYPFVSQDAPGILSKDPFNSTVDDDAKSLRENILLPLLKDGKSIVLLMHSYGGIYGSAAVEGLSHRERKEADKEGGIIGLIYVTAVTPVAGESLLDRMQLTTEKLPQHVELDESTGQITLVDPYKWMYHNIPQSDANKWIAQIKPQAFESVNTAISYSPLEDPKYEGLSGYIFCGKDRVLPLEAQEHYANLSKITHTATVEAASHAFFAGTCDETVAATISLLESINKLAANSIARDE